MKKAKIALIGCWHVHAGDYAGQTVRRNDTELCYVWDKNPQWGKSIADTFGGEYTDDLEKVLNSDVDGVIITTETSLHKDIMVKCADKGKHIFTEKVLALTMAEALAIKEAVIKNGVKFCISFPRRTMPEILFAKQAVDSGLLGEVNYMRVRFAHDGESGNWLPPHFYDEKETGGGAMVDLGAHPMYICRWIMGRPQSISSTFTMFGEKRIDDNDVAVMEFASGAIAIAETGFVTPHNPYSLEIFGTQSSLYAGGAEGGVRYFSNAEKGWVKPANLPQKMTEPIDQWIDSILSGGEIVFGLDEGVALTEITEAAYQSYRQNKKIEL